MSAVTAAPAVSGVEERARAVAAVAAEHADEVDRDSRFPNEAVAALRESGLPWAAAPVELGGEGLTFAALAAIAAILGAACSSTAMVFAMHVSQLVSVTRHADASPATRALARRIVRDRLLLASATTEVGTGGDLGRSLCFVEPDGDRVRLTKQAPVISYAEHADMILVTARRDADAPAADQVLVAADRRDLTLTATSDWDALGLRGTCSRGYVLEANVPAENVIPVPYETIGSQSMVPSAHILWAGVWLGMARVTVERAHAFVRAAARRSIGTTPPSAPALVSLVAQRDALAALVTESSALIDRSAPSDLEALGPAARLAMLKVSAADAVTSIVAGCLSVTGIAGFRNDGPYSVARVFRDAQAAPLQVHNDRIVGQAAQMLLVQKAI